MIEFNPDGSIKLPGKLARIKAESEKKMQNARCIKIRKEIVSSIAPKSCTLHLTISSAITDNRFIENIYAEFVSECNVSCKMIKHNEKEYDVVIGTCFTRCSDCSSLINKYRSFLDGNVIEHQGGCEFKRKMQQRFCEEDYFD